MSKSSYYDWLGNYEIRQAKLSKEQELAHKVVAEFNRSRQTYGEIRICLRLSRDGAQHNHKQVLEIMKIHPSPHFFMLRID